MTNPDAPSPHDVSPTFKWSNKYDDQLRYIADTDELPDAEDTYQWSDLRDAIKFKIRQAVDAFDENPSPILHPAAKMATVSNSVSASSMSSDGAGLGITNLGSSQQQAAQGLENRFASTSSAANSNGRPTSAPANGNYSSSSSSSSESEEDVSMSFEDKEDDEDGNDSEGDEGALPSSSPDYGPPAGMQQGAHDSSLVSEANRSGFFPAKTKAPAERKGNWARVLSKTETQQEMSLIFSMLDDFDVSPPFTIQRLSELLLSPNQFVRSAPKFLSSLMRLLSVTASHADFPPVSPGQPPIGAMPSTANGGGVSVRSVGPPSPSTEPLFSPIPFLQRPGAQSSEGEAEEGRGDGDDAVPALDLNQSESSSVSTQTSATAASASIPLPPVSSSTSTSSGSLGSNATSQPLGVPPGQIDELEEEGNASGGDSTTDQTTGTSTASTTSSAHHMDGAVHPLSSTTTPAKTATATASSSGQDDDHEREDDVATSHKRLRSQSPKRGQQEEGEGEGAQTGIERAGKEAEQLEHQQQEQEQQS